MVPYLRKATIADLPVVMALIDDAKRFLKASGSDQWQAGEPNELQMKQVIEQDNCYVLQQAQTVIATATVLIGREQTYDKLTTWHGQVENYATIHRFTVSQQLQGHGLAQQFLRLLISAIRLQGVVDLRMDTHPANVGMQHVIQKATFQYRGAIYLQAEPTPKRLAYQLTLPA